VGKREISLTLLIAAVTAYAATLAPASARIVVYYVAALGAVLLIWDTVQRQVRRRRGQTSKHPKTELAIVHRRTFAEIKGYGFPFNNPLITESGAFGLMDVTCRCFVSVPDGSPIVQLLSGTASIEIDGKRYEEEVRINQSTLAWQLDGYRIPPFVEAGETLQIDVQFFGRVLRDKGWIQPRECKIRKLVLIDQFKKKHRLREDITFHASWISTPPSL
jgi:hypothetical protein